MITGLRHMATLSACVFGFVLYMVDVPAQADDLPSAVKSEITSDIDACKSSGGIATPARRAVKTGDANQDGQPDYLLDEGKLCKVAFCGSGGCSFILFLSGPDGVKKAFEGLGTSPKIGTGSMSYLGASGRSKIKISGYSAEE